MWFKLASATFQNSLGKMSDLSNSWPVTYTLSGGISKNSCPSSVTKNSDGSAAKEAFTATFTIKSGESLTSIMAFIGGEQVGDTVTTGNSITIAAADITGPITIEASATGSSGGTSDGDTTTPTGRTYPVTLTASDLSVGVGFNWGNAYPATKTQATRMSYVDFDLRVDTTKKYTITYETNSDSPIYFGVHAWDTVADAAIQAQSGTLARTNTNRTGWESSGYSFLGSITSEAGNAIAGFRISFGKGESGTESFDGTEVTSVTIVEEDV